MYKIIKINNPEILKKKHNKLWDIVDYVVMYDNGTTHHILKNIEDFKVDEFKIELIKKGYNEKDLDELINLSQEATRSDAMREEID